MATARGRRSPPEALVSPRQVADALGVSESSVKRWSDQGLIVTRKTAGGHRKLALADVLRFTREHGYDIGRPESLGLPARTARADDHATLAAQLVTALLAGDAETVRTTVLALFRDGMPLTELFDRVLAPAVRELGDRWEHGQVRVFEEHRATVIVHRTLLELRQIVPRTAPRRQTAVLATLGGDPYTIAVTMAELTLLEIGWTPTNLGPDTPAATAIEAIESLHPRVLALGINTIDDPAVFVSTYRAVAEAARARRVAIVIGGPATTAELCAQIHYATRCTSMRELADFCASLEPDATRPPA